MSAYDNLGPQFAIQTQIRHRHHERPVHDEPDAPPRDRASRERSRGVSRGAGRVLDRITEVTRPRP